MLVKVAAYLRKNHIALLALFFALGGTSFAAAEKFVLPKNSVGTRQLRKNAVVSSKIKNNQVLGADVRESSLSKVPRAGHADSADNAGKAATALNASNAANAAALGGAPASSFETKDQTTARYGTPFMAHAFVQPGTRQLVALDGLGKFELLCSSSPSVQYTNTTPNPEHAFESDDGRPGSDNGIFAFLNGQGDKLVATGFTPVPGSGSPVTVTEQTTTWHVINNQTQKWATANIAATYDNTVCYYFVEGRVVG